MRARLKSIASDDIDDLARWRPPEPDAFAVPLTLSVGPLGLRGKETFELLAVTPRWLLARHGKEGAVLGRGLLLVFEWDFARIKAFLAKKVEACSAPTWPELAKKVERIAEWEGDGENVVGLR